MENFVYSKPKYRFKIVYDPQAVTWTGSIYRYTPNYGYQNIDEETKFLSGQSKDALLTRMKIFISEKLEDRNNNDFKLSVTQEDYIEGPEFLFDATIANV